MGRRRDERGAALIVAIFVSTLLAALAVTLAQVMRMNLAVAGNQANAERGLMAANGGVALARALLLYEDPSYDALTDDWGEISRQSQENPLTVGDGRLTLQIEDASAKINVNTAPRNTLVSLLGEDVADAIVDWRSATGVTPQAAAEREYYASLPSPYLPRHGPLQSLGELLLVRGITADNFFGSDQAVGWQDLLTVRSGERNVSQTGYPRFNLNTVTNDPLDIRERGAGELQQYLINVGINSQDALAAANRIIVYREQLGRRRGRDPSQPFRSVGELLDVGLPRAWLKLIVDAATVRNEGFLEGMVNVNTAPRQVLLALPGSSEALADSILSHRSESGPFLTTGELLDLPDMTDASFKAMIPYVATKSAVYQVEAMGRFGDAAGYRTIGALLSRESAPGPVLMVEWWEVGRPIPGTEATRAPA